MGFHANERQKARCPLYVSVVRSEQSGIYGIHCCQFAEGPDDRGSSLILRFDDMESLLDAKSIYCDDITGYPMCQLYRVWHDEVQTK